MRKKSMASVRRIILLSLILLFVVGTGLFLGSRYIYNQLMHSGEAAAIDIALLVKNNFVITDEEVNYMKSLSFNDMEVDPINQRLIRIGDGVKLNARVTNVYLLMPLARDEMIYCEDKKAADFLGINMERPMDAMWLLNGKINEQGEFVVARRDDIYRYTVLDEEQKQGMIFKQPFGTYSSDAWGNYITGYAPVYTTEGNFVGLLGIDTDPDPYRLSIEKMVVLLVVLIFLTMIMMFGLFLTFYIKYMKVRDGKLQFEFYSRMSHEMRTPMNGILGMAAVSKNESDATVLRHNMELIEDSGKSLLNLINQTLDYQNETELYDTTKSLEVPKQHADSKLQEKNHLYAVLKGSRILLCEDQHINAEITRKLLERMGSEVIIAENGQAGLELFKQSKYGEFKAILMDIRMPVMDGIEATVRIRSLAREDAATIPIVAVTANSYDEDQKATKDAGMNAHLTKPVAPEQLYITLAQLIQENS